MKEINQEKFKKMLSKVRVQLGMVYFGASNNLRMSVKFNDKSLTPQQMSDEQLVLLWQLCHGLEDILGREQARRGLLPDDLAAMYNAAPQQPTSPIMNETTNDAN